MNEELNIVLDIYRGLIRQVDGNGCIPIQLRPSSIVGTVQDDPFDCWVERELKAILPKEYEVFHSGKLTTPDLIIRNTRTGFIIGLEIKKLIQKSDGKDSRGLTLDYNSCLPCGKAMVKCGDDTIIVPCYYLFALLNPTSDRIATLIILDGDFINYDFELHKEAKYSNFTEYNHGPYGEGSVRHREMYTYPNPLNSQIEIFFRQKLLVVKSNLLRGSYTANNVKDVVIRTDKYDNDFRYSIIDETSQFHKDDQQLTTLKDIFDGCKKRKPKERVAYIPEIPSIEPKCSK